MRKVVFLRRIIFIFLICTSCWWYLIPYDRPDNIQHFLKKEGYTLFYPICSPDGSKIYYLCNRHAGGLGGADSGSLWVVNADGTHERNLLSDGFCGLTVSPDGSKLAVISGSIYEGGVMILLNSDGIIRDTVPTTPKKVFHVEFNHNGTKLYYNGGGYFYRINIDGTNEESLFYSRDNMHFDVFPNDSIYYGEAAPAEKYDICPTNHQKVVVGNVAGALAGDLRLRDLSTGKDALLNAKPFRYSLAAYPAWFPDGKKVIFAGSEENAEYMNHLNGELWILELEQ